MSSDQSIRKTQKIFYLLLLFSVDRYTKIFRRIKNRLKMYNQSNQNIIIYLLLLLSNTTTTTTTTTISYI